MLGIELLEHVGFELAVGADGVDDLLALFVRGRLDQVGDLRRVQLRQPPNAMRSRAVGTWPTNGSTLAQSRNGRTAPAAKRGGSSGERASAKPVSTPTTATTPRPGPARDRRPGRAGPRRR